MSDASTILCFGDSNTWGFDPRTEERNLYDDRWPSVLQKELGSAVRVIPEGLNGRTITSDDSLHPHRNGLAALPMLLQTHKPLDLVVIMLGTNDCKQRFALSPRDMAEGIRRLIQTIRGAECGRAPMPEGDTGPLAPIAAPPPCLVVAPPHILGETTFGEIFAGGREKSLRMAAEYRRVCDEERVEFLDGAELARCSPDDGIHLDAENQRALGKGIAERVREMLG
jgi:lysophospholipase L1-like esterase